MNRAVIEMRGRTLFKRSIKVVVIMLLICEACLHAAPRVALMDFSTDDNSYRSIQAAANFTSLVQAGLFSEPDIEWVERAQINLAKQEFGLTKFKAAAGESPVQRGRMLGADWLVMGHFSSDDQNRSTLSLQLVELKYADAIARETLTFQERETNWIRLGQREVIAASNAVKQLLVKGQASRQQATNQARVAFLYLADTTQHGLNGGTDILAREFSGALERCAATNNGIRLIQFPKAYQSTDESEMVVDGIIEAGEESWRRTADLYVWGTYSVTNARVAGKFTRQMNIILNFWDGVSRPTVLDKQINLSSMRETLPADVMNSLISEFTQQVLAKARLQRNDQGSAEVRQKIAASIVKAYAAMTSRGSNLGFGDKKKFVQAVHMLETACFFDPDNAEARVLWMSCRYGFWIEFGSDVKNQFWTMWRRSQAWGKYVERFGLKPVKAELPFPYNMKAGISEIYVGSLDELVKMFPQWHSLEEVALEDKWRQEGTHTWLVEAVRHGFPTEIPNALAWEWKQEVLAEVIQRQKRADEYSQANPKITDTVPTNSTAKVVSSHVGTGSNQPIAATGRLPAGAGSSQPAAPKNSAMVSSPAWLKDFMPIFNMFRLYPPNALPFGVKPEIKKIQFPTRFEIKTIKQMTFHKDKVWILAMDERSAPSSDATPDLSAETIDERNRLWCLDAESEKPALLAADLLPASINSFLLQGEELWLAGDAVTVMDLKSRGLKKFGLADGLAMNDVESLTVSGGRVYAAGNSFKISSYDANTGRWSDFPTPKYGTMSHGTDNPNLLFSNDQSLGYVAGGTFLYDFASKAWTNLAQINSSRCFVAEGNKFWIGSENSLNLYDATKKSSQSWNSPVFIQSPMISMVGGSYFGGNPMIPQDRLDQMEQQLIGGLVKIEDERKLAKVSRNNSQRIVDPFQMTTHMPGGVGVMANDGDYLWLGSGNYHGDYLMLLHKPSHSLVASFTLGTRGHISGLAISDKYVWVGIAYGDDAVIRLSKDVFFSVPQSQWTNLEIKSAEREQLVRSMSKRDQAMYALLAGDDRRVVELLSDLNPDKASLEDMLCLAWSCDASGVDDLEKCNKWLKQIAARFPDSPWAKYAVASAKANDAAHEIKKVNALALAKFDRNHDGKLDETENREMMRDKEFSKMQIGANEQQSRLQMDRIVTRYDLDKNLKLNKDEITTMCQTIKAYLQAQREMPEIQRKNRMLDRLISKKATVPEEILSQYDANNDLCLDAIELGVLATDIQKEK